MTFARLARAFALACLLLCLPSAAIAQEAIQAPAGFVPKQAMTFAGPDGKALTVSATNPLPTSGGGGGGGSNASVSATGSAAPASATFAGGRTPANNLVGIGVDSGGRLLPGQAVATSTRTTVGTSTATSIDILRNGRVGYEVQIETTLTANLYICLNGQTGCSATVYDKMIPSGAGAGTNLVASFGFSPAAYAFTTQAGVIVSSTSWLIQ